MVIRADDELFDPDRVLPKWFEVHQESVASLNQILAFNYVQAPFADVHFLALVYGLEGLHRKRETVPEHVSSTRSRIEQATASLSSRTRAYLKYLLDRGADPTLEQRLLGMVDVAGASLAPLLATFPEYASRIARTRNVMAHQLNEQAPISSAELSDVVESLRFLAQAYLLRTMGWTEDQVKWIFLRRPDYGQFVSYRGGSLLTR
jgi:hypothetical protein